jgi:hypothetical protein
MEFRTKIALSNNQKPIDYNSKIVSMGSCFALNIDEKFDFYKFQSSLNPFGIIFNPVSIEKIIFRVANGILFTEDDVFYHNERWHSFEVHSDLSKSDKNEFLNNLNSSLHKAKQSLLEASYIIITYGTAWVYRNKATKEIVANCHKLPQKEFSKELLSINEIENSIKKALNLIQNINPKVSFILTLSPVRHLKDGFVENQQSKAHLISALHSSDVKQSDYNYFPAYEIMMDELRDYRFYSEDMMHPSQIAIEYIWQRFSESNFSAETHSTMKEVEDIQKGLAHKPFNNQSEAHQLFLLKLTTKIAELETKFSHIQF